MSNHIHILGADSDLTDKNVYRTFKDIADICNTVVFERGFITACAYRDVNGWRRVAISDDHEEIRRFEEYLPTEHYVHAFWLDNAKSIKELRTLILDHVWSHCHETAENALFF